MDKKEFISSDNTQVIQTAFSQNHHLRANVRLDLHMYPSVFGFHCQRIFACLLLLDLIKIRIDACL